MRLLLADHKLTGSAVFINFFLIAGICSLFVISTAFADELLENNVVVPLVEPASIAQVWQLPSGEASEILDVLEVKDMDINDLFRMLSAKTGLNIIAGKSVQGRVTIFLKNVDVRDALAIILRSNGLAYVEHHGVIEIMSNEEYEQKYDTKFGVVVTTEVFKLQHAKAEDVLKTVAALNTRGVGHVEFDALSNRLIVTDTQPKFERIRKLIAAMDQKQEEVRTEVLKLSYGKAEDIIKTVAPLITTGLGHVEFDVFSNKIVVTDTISKIATIRNLVASMDQKQREVFVEARIIQVDLTDAFRMGINWDLVLNHKDKSMANSRTDFGLSETVPKSITTIGTLTSDNYAIALNMIASMGRTKLLSNPRVVVVNNQEARIHIGEVKPYITTASTTPSSGPVTTSETVNFIDVGVKLNVTPMIHDDGYITMKIRPEISSANSSITTSEKNQIPIVDTSEVETTVRVKDGITIIIAGLIKDESSETKGKIPILGDIPLIGRVFRSESHEKQKTEIVIFLTPFIINGDVGIDPQRYSTIKGDKSYF